MFLCINVNSAFNLPNLEQFTKSDLMAVTVSQGHGLLCIFYLLLLNVIYHVALCILGDEMKTKVTDNNLDPVWDEVSACLLYIY